VGYPRGFLHGLVLGGALGLLLAPMPGGELRRRLQDAWSETQGFSEEPGIEVRAKRKPRQPPAD